MTMSMSDRDEQLDGFVQAFERAYHERGGADPADFLPPAGHPLRRDVLRELVRVDLEYRWEHGRPKPLDDYRRDFPALDDDRDGLREIAFEEFRLRRRAGQAPSTDEYFDRYGLALDPKPARPSPPPSPSPSPKPSAPRPAPVMGRDGLSLHEAGTRRHHASPSDAGRPALPDVGGSFLGFRLVDELGRGSFGRVYLALQGDLADRPVVLKITAKGPDESRTLAQLRHDNIVPIYSHHRHDGLDAVCMPYLGSVTLRDVVEDLKGQGSLPESGHVLLSSLGKSRTRRPGPPDGSAPTADAPAGSESGSAAAGTPGRPAPADPVSDPTRPAVPLAEAKPGSDARAILGGLSYAEAVVWMAAKLAGGLAHAHERGILHRDLKPANVLLADDGRPLLLDFNLAEDLKRPAGHDGAGVGGTLPYMSPEHLEAFQGAGRQVDARSDLFAFGVIFFEMLTGRPPYPSRDGRRPGQVEAMIADRRKPPPALRGFNPSVSPAVESVIRRCLEPDPARRYASARELAEDLERHLSHRPLRYADDPSPRERAAKWVRRHPLALLAGLALVALGALAFPLIAARGQAARLGAAEAARRFRSAAADARDQLDARGREPGKLREGLAAAERALATVRRPGTLNTSWWQDPPASRLDPDDRARLRVEAGDLLLSVAWAEAAAAGGDPNPRFRERGLRRALEAGDRAQACYGEGSVPQSLWDLRARALRDLGDREKARGCESLAKTTPLRTARDHALAGGARLALGRHSEALPLFEQATRLDPRDASAWFGTGLCRAALRYDAEAGACFATCSALRDDHPAPWFNRGVVALRLQRPAEAESYFARAESLRPGNPEVIANLGFASLAQGRPAEAVGRFTAAIELGSPYTRLYLARAEARTRLGDVAGAARDRREAMNRTPTDAASWVARGNARLRGGDALGALADFDAALALDPDSYPALQSKVYLLSERLGAVEEAAGLLGRVLALFPDQAPARATRALLLARLGRREPALAEARRALTEAPSPPVLYQCAGVYARTSVQNEEDRDEAVRLLLAALAAGHPASRVGSEPDFEPVRDHPRFPTPTRDTSPVPTRATTEIARP